MNDNSSLVQTYGKICRIKSKKSGRYLSISRDPETKGVAILGQNKENLSTQFMLVKENLCHKFQSLLNNQYLTIAYGSNKAGTMLVTLPDYRDASQRFILKLIDIKGDYVISSYCGMVLDCFEEGTQNGTRIIQWYQLGLPHQIWEIQFI